MSKVIFKKMAKIERDKFDIFTLIVKQQFIGVDMIMDDDEILTVSDFYCDYATDEVHVEFTDGSSSSFNLKDKFVVRIEDTYNKVTSKKKVKNRK